MERTRGDLGSPGIKASHESTSSAREVDDAGQRVREVGIRCPLGSLFAFQEFRVSMMKSDMSQVAAQRRGPQGSRAAKTTTGRERERERRARPPPPSWAHRSPKSGPTPGKTWPTSGRMPLTSPRVLADRRPRPPRPPACALRGPSPSPRRADRCLADARRRSCASSTRRPHISESASASPRSRSRSAPSCRSSPTTTTSAPPLVATALVAWLS